MSNSRQIRADKKFVTALENLTNNVNKELPENSHISMTKVTNHLADLIREMSINEIQKGRKKGGKNIIIRSEIRL